ncbi:MAG: primosomal protein N' [Puniceicoccales bacterium]|jgi:primosomal protein N' (replication factor Y)|nr:primosomal protein N' [Puniceicoccales bacterium]
MQLARVVLFSAVDRAFVYIVRKELVDVLVVGMLVQVPLGPRLVQAVVLELIDSDGDSYEFELREISSIVHAVPVVSNDVIALCRWVSEYYNASLASVFECAVPSVLRRNFSTRLSTVIKVAKLLDDNELLKLFRKAPKQHQAYSYLRTAGGCPRKDLLELFSVSVVNSLVDKGIFIEEFRNEPRLAQDDDQAEGHGFRALTLTKAQQAVADDIKASLARRLFSVHLLQGVTGSGKTEVYLDAIESVIKHGGEVLYLVPELALTPQTLARIRNRFSGYGVVLWHSNLSDGERKDAWLAIASGEVSVVVGARSALFVPLKNLQLVIVDEEHDQSYKQSDQPRYNGRDVAVYRAKLNDALCILGSATPSTESYLNVYHKGYRLNELNQRVGNSRLPTIHLVDRRYEKCIISNLLRDKIFDRLEKNEQVILLLNRRGYAPTALCPSCDYVARCPNCDVSLSYHRSQQAMKCHFCGYTEPPRTNCPKCGGLEIFYNGVGTQRLEQIISGMFPGASIARIDSDVMRKKDEFRIILSKFRKGLVDILLGTQMIAKGLDFPNVTLVGVVDCDISLNVQDFRSMERTFQMIVQVAGRAGRGDRNGEVVLQTFRPECMAITKARSNDFYGFMELELATRRHFGYPPYRKLIRHVIMSRNETKAEFFANNWGLFLEKNITDPTLEMKGPTKCMIEKINGWYRFAIYFFVVGSVGSRVKTLDALRKEFAFPRDIREYLDVDPADCA